MPIEKLRLMCLMRSVACAKPPSSGTKSASPAGGSPRRAMTFSMPADSRRTSTAWTASVVWAEHVRWAITSMSVSWRALTAISSVRARVVPPAPYVTEMKLGQNGFSRSSVLNTPGIRSRSLGGKNSNESVRCLSRMWRILIEVAPRNGGRVREGLSARL